jgi:hypothetical protein
MHDGLLSSLVITSLVACASAQTKPDRRTVAGPMRFDWSPPCRVPVTIKAVADDGPGTVELDFVIRDAGSGEIIAGYENVRATGPAHKQAELDRMAAALETSRWYLATDGRFLRADTDPFYEALAAAESQKVREGGEPNPTLAILLQSPVLRKAAAGGAGEIWGYWVALWLGLELQEGERQTRDMDVAYGIAVISTPVTFQHQGAAASGRLVRLMASFDDDGSSGVEFGRLIRSEMARIYDLELPPEDPKPEPRHVEVTAELDPSNLRPASVRSEVSKPAPGLDGVDSEPSVTSYAFDWSRAQGCGATVPLSR